jgi:hypothetical protein
VDDLPAVRRGRKLTQAERQEHVSTLELLARLVIGVAVPLATDRSFILMSAPEVG